SVLETIKQEATTDSNDDFKKRLENLISKILNLLEYTTKIEKTDDPEMLADLYYKISIGYSVSPSLRITWIDNLSNIQKQHLQLEEAAQCKVHCAYLVAQYLSQVEKFPL